MDMKTNLNIILVVIVLLIAGSLLFVEMKQGNINSVQNNPPEQIACTLEAKICPDGSSVGRHGPNCDFDPCPQAPVVDLHANIIKVSAPLPNALIATPLVVKGDARGTWYFEASFPVKLFDANGKQLAAVPAQAKGDWMTTDFVPFEAILNFTKPATSTGTLVLEKDNPSGDPAKDDSISIPVVFSQ